MIVEKWALAAEGGEISAPQAALSMEQHMVDAFREHAYREYPGLAERWVYSEFAMDSACTVTLFFCALVHILYDAVASRLRVRGYQGDNVSTAEAQGVLHAWAIATHGERTAGQTGALGIDGHALGGLNSNLMSVNAPIWRDRMRLVLCNPAHGASSLVTFPLGNGQAEVVVPVRYNALTQHWYARFILGTDATTARKVGLE